MALASLDDTTEYVNALYFGDPGSGKTTDAAHMAKLGRVVVVDAEAGLKKRPLQRLGIDPANIFPHKVEAYADLDRLYWAVKAKLEEEPGYFAGVIFDSFTEIQKKLIEDIVGTRYEKNVRQAERGGFEVKDDPFAVDRDEYGKMTEMCRRLARRFRDLPCHTAFVCLTRRDVDKEGDGGIFYRPALTPAFATDLMGYVDVVAYTQEESDADLGDFSRFVGLTRPVGKYRGKDRYGATPPVFPNPTFDRLVEFVRQEDVDPEEAWAADPYVRQRLIRIGELPDPSEMSAEPILG